MKNIFIDKIWEQQDTFLSKFDTIKVPRGGLDKAGANALHFLFNKVKRKGVKLLEIGSWTGASSIILGTLAKKYKGTLHCVDWFEGSTDSNLGCADYVNIHTIFLENIVRTKLENIVKVDVMPSRGVEEGFKDNSLDMIFIDGDHRYNSVMEDIEICWPKVKKGGILCGHDCEYLIKDYKDLFVQTENVDYTRCHTGVIRAVYETFGDKANLTKEGYIWWIKK